MMPRQWGTGHNGQVFAIWSLSAQLLLLLFSHCIYATTSSLSTSLSSTSIIKTKNYIDTISGYDELSSCAEDVLSTVVRGEYSGCADRYALTSYTCFCTDSSSYMSAVISSDVMSSCDSSVASEQASSAGAVFDAYCKLGVRAGLEEGECGCQLVALMMSGQEKGHIGQTTSHFD